MELFTGYYAKHGNHPNAVAISQGVPEWFHGRVNKLVAPDWDIIMAYKNGQITEEEYTKRYTAQLDRIGINKILTSFKDGDVLLCYEKSGRFCHRHILAEWLEYYGYFVDELD